MNKRKRPWLCILLGIMTFFLFVGCSNSNVSEEDYKKQVKDIWNSMSQIVQEDSANINEAVNQGAEELKAATKKLIEDTTPLFQKIADLEAPKQFKETQANIKKSALASIESQKISSELLELSGDKTIAVEERTKKVQELQGKFEKLKPDVENLRNEVFKVIGAQNATEEDAPAGSDPAEEDAAANTNPSNAESGKE